MVNPIVIGALLVASAGTLYFLSKKPAPAPKKKRSRRFQRDRDRE